MAETYMDPFHLTGESRHPELAHKMEPGGSRLFIGEHFHLLKLSRQDPGAQGLAQGFLGRKPGRIGFHAVGPFRFAVSDFILGKGLFLEPRLLQGPFHPAHFQDIHTNAKNHNHSFFHAISILLK